MSICYQLFSTDLLATSEVEKIINKIGGYCNVIGDYTIEDEKSCIWISHQVDKIDEDYYQDEIDEINDKFHLHINYVINIELSSNAESKNLLFKFYIKVKSSFPNIILMDQDGLYFNDIVI